ncbi:MAG TPA: glycosyltransferase family A protein [Methylocella sp.]|nr:glycosyltransferase family A protein [Methylocella sp.]
MASLDVVVTCYQYGHFLRECVASILAQQIDGLRVLIIDNASTDNSLEVARQLAEEDCRIEVAAHERNLGHVASFNEGIDWAKADYFAMVCADDLLTPGSFARAISFLEQHREAGFAIGKEILFRDGEALPEIPLEGEAQWRILSGPDFIADRCRKLYTGPAVVRTAIQKKAGHYREALFFTCDYEMLLRLATFGDVAETAYPQGYRRLHGTNLAVVHQLDRALDLGEFEAAFESFFQNEGRPLAEERHLDRLARRNLVENAYWWGVRDLTKGRWRAGFSLLRFAFTRSPILLFVPPLGFLCEENRPLYRLAQAVQKIILSSRKYPQSPSATPPVKRTNSNSKIAG